ncbi:Zinc finger, BED-type [Sesbania bispinosa]|nr:Zinc finger, BED-type [Sesbania bispinosa]
MSNEEFHIEDEIEESSTSNSKRVKTYVAWEFFEKFGDDKGLPKAKYKNCAKVYKARDGGGSSNMRHHVNKCASEGEVSSYPPLDQEKFWEKISEYLETLLSLMS